MATLQQRHNRWRAIVRIPKELRPAYDGREHLYHTLATTDLRAAKAEAGAWEAMLRAEWAVKLGQAEPRLSSIRQVYEASRRNASEGGLAVHGGEHGDPSLDGIDFEIAKLADEVGEGELTPLQSAKLAGLQDAFRDLNGQKVKPRRELEPIFAELAADYMRQWKAQQGLKDSNTEQQKEATYRLFAGYWGARPVRGMTRAQAAVFIDELRTFDPSWARSPAARELPWNDLKRSFAGSAKGLSDATMNRHVATLAALWDWAEERELCDNRNPFRAHRRRLQPGRNVQGYLPWEPDQLKKLFSPPPSRTDLTELMMVGLHSGMRLNEIASLEAQHIRQERDVWFMSVDDAKTPAGVRQVPIHPALTWLIDRAKETATGPLWPTFNPEGPGKKRGADAGREFSRFKIKRGYSSRRLAFHSFRKNVTRIMERAGVPEGEWAQVFGHERGFTYGTYNPDGITIERKAQTIALIDYPAIPFPDFTA